MTRPSDIHRERGSALTFAIVVMVLASIVIVAIMTMLDFSGQRSRANTDRMQNVAVVDRALASYEYALEAGMTNEYDSFRLSATAMMQLASESGATPVANATFGSDFRRYGLEKTWMSDPGGSGNYAWSMRNTLPAPDGRSSWWQLVSVVPPGNGDASVVAYLRTWVATGGPASRVVTEPRLVRAELRPGRFSDYEMLVDGPLVLGRGTTINGRVHTNGYPDAYLIDFFARAGWPIKLGNSEGLPVCGAGAAFSTAKGRIDGRCTGTVAPRQENTGRFIDLLRGRSHLQMMQRMCGAVVRCPGGTGPWTITLAGNRATFRPTSGGSTTISVTGNTAVYIKGEARMSGQLSSGHMTIGIAGQPGSFGTFGSASLSLTGNGMIGASGSAILGLVVEGDILPRIDQGFCPDGLRAAVVSASGALTFPAQYRVPSMGGGNPPSCGSFTFDGSLGTHYAPLLYLNWGGPDAGYSTRNYKYDVRLRTDPPPLFPLTGPWQVSSWKDGVPECLTAARRGDATCG